MRVGVVGSGLAGLSAAFYLCRYSRVDIVVLEVAPVFGGRANVITGAEHCARLFLDDYSELFAILRSIPGAGAGSVYDGLRPVRRYCHTETSGWVEVSHLYSIFAQEVTVAEKLKVAWARRASPLLAAHPGGRNTNRYGSFKNYSLRSLVGMARNLGHSRNGYAFDGATDLCLIEPWVAYLRRQGVALVTDSAVDALRPRDGGVDLRANGIWERFDAVIVTSFAPDLASLLAASGLRHRIRPLDHTHCKCVTVDLDPREPVLASAQVAFYARHGLNVVVQPRHRRCVVLCARCPSTGTDDVARAVAAILPLRYPVVGVLARENQLPDEAIYTADYLDPDQVLVKPAPGVYLAGSWLKNSYPVDSGEGAARSARAAVDRLVADLDLRPVLEGGE